MAALMRRKIKRYGWIPDLPDRRDRMFAAPAAHLRALPPSVDLTATCPPVYDQGELGSCTANAIAGALQFDQHQPDHAPRTTDRAPRCPDTFTPSRLFIYYNERVVEGTVDEDSGATLRDGIKSVAKQGAPHEPLWPYVIARFRTKPSPKAYSDGRRHRALRYERVPRLLDQMQACLAAGFPFVFGFSVYESFESRDVARTGVMPMPEAGEVQLGGHAVLAVGYDTAARRFLIRNSWGPAWGRKGYFTMPFDYLVDDALSDDFWTVKGVA
jgi:C1A family cysteine protease